MSMSKATMCVSSRVMFRSRCRVPLGTKTKSVNAPHLVALVRNGAVFKKGKLVERSTARGRASLRASGAVRSSPN